MNGAKRSAEAVGCKNESVGERSALEERTRASSGGRSGSENVGLSNANIGENPMPRKPKGSLLCFPLTRDKGLYRLVAADIMNKKECFERCQQVCGAGARHVLSYGLHFASFA